MKGVADDDLEIGTVHQPGLDLSEESLARLHPEEDIETASRVIVVIAIDQHERGSAACVDVPRFPVGEPVREIEVESGDGEVVAEPELDVRTERDVLDDWLGLEMPADQILIGIGGSTDTHSKRLRGGGSCGQAQACGERAQAQQ